MKRLLVIITVLALISVPVVLVNVLAESDDGVFWMPVTMDKIQETLTDQLGFTPQTSLEVGGSGKYPVLSIYLPGETIQKMLRLENGQLYIADTDWFALSNGELRNYATRFKESMVLFYPTEDSDGHINYIGDMTTLILKTSNTGTAYIMERDRRFSIPISYFETLDDGTIMIDGFEFAQAIYDLTMKQ